MIERFNAPVLGRLLFPGIVQTSWRENYVDFRIASSREWRDIYRYAPDRTLTGWRRYQPEGIVEFNAEGLLIVGKDTQGRCMRGRVVRYELETDKRDPAGRMKRVKLTQTDTFREYEYEGANDWKGHIKK